MKQGRDGGADPRVRNGGHPSSYQSSPHSMLRFFEVVRVTRSLTLGDYFVATLAH